MAYQETTRTGYGTRLKNSFGRIATGFILFVGASALLWWNEGRAVKTAKMLNEAQGAYVEMTDISKVAPQYNGKLVFATGLATTKDTLCDPTFGVKSLALSMHRRVEYFQWKEEAHQEKRDKMGGGEETVTTYTYKMDWVGRPVESGNFHDPQYRNRNFVLMNINDVKYASDKVTFGAYRLSKNQVASLNPNEKFTVSVPASKVKSLDRTVRQSFNHHARLAMMTPNSYGYGDTRSYGKSELSTSGSDNGDTGQSEFIHVSDNVVYVGVSPATPTVGDVRISYTRMSPTQVSLLARVNGDTFGNYTAKNGQSFSSISVGTKTADEMFKGEHNSNTMWTWLLRGLGLLLVIGGLKGIFGFLETILKVIPPLAGILGFGVEIICSVVGFVWSLLIISLSWLFYRPLLGVGLLLIAALIVFAFSKKGKALIARHITEGRKVKTGN